MSMREKYPIYVTETGRKFRFMAVMPDFPGLMAVSIYEDELPCSLRASISRDLERGGPHLPREMPTPTPISDLQDDDRYTGGHWVTDYFETYQPIGD